MDFIINTNKLFDVMGVDLERNAVFVKVYKTYVKYNGEKINLHINECKKFNLPILPINLIVKTGKDKKNIEIREEHSINLLNFLNGYPTTPLKYNCEEFCMIVNSSPNRICPPVYFDETSTKCNEAFLPVEVFQPVGIYERHLHTALYITDDLFLNKFGLGLDISATNKAEMLKMYPGKIRYSYRAWKCDTCKTEKQKEELYNCTKCKNASYCNIECQKKDWPIHRKQCKTSYTMDDKRMKYQSEYMKLMEEVNQLNAVK